ncbi:MAG: flavodoxin family protein [Prevotella sp.]
MHILTLSGSPRKGGNTDMFAEAFARGAHDGGHDVRTVSVHDVNVRPCMGCNACFRREDMSCVQHDDMADVYALLSWADMLVIASPVYFYGVSSQLKAIIDRCHNPIRDTFHIRKAALLLVGAASLPDLFDSITTQYRLCLRFFNIEDAGQILVRGAREKGDVRQTDALEKAYMMGRRL